MKLSPNGPDPVGATPPARRTDGRPLVIVHGGTEANRYRDVLAALVKAITLHADYFEFDIRRTADQVLVVHHDDQVADTSLQALSFVDAERAAASNGYELPRLEHVLARARGRIRLDLELKEQGTEAAVLDALRDHGFRDDEVVVTSFEQAALDSVQTRAPGVATGLLVWNVEGLEALDRFARSGATFLGPDSAILDDPTLEEASRRAVPLVPWTVNDARAIGRLQRCASVVGIITDRPELALGVR